MNWLKDRIVISIWGICVIIFIAQVIGFIVYRMLP